MKKRSPAVPATPQSAAMRRKSAADAPYAAFGRYLDELLRKGIRPDPKNREPWTNPEFAEELPGREAGTKRASDTAVGTWRRGEVLPSRINPILDALFGNNTHWASERRKLQKLFTDACEIKKTRKTEATLKRAPFHSLGAIWILRDRVFVPERPVRPEDERAAGSVLQQQLHAELCAMATALADAAKGPSNSDLMNSLRTEIGLVRDYLQGDLTKVTGHLGRLYPHALMLGALLEDDDVICGDASHADTPFPTHIRSRLAVFVRTFAPWLRGFPSVAELDDKNRQYVGNWLGLLDPAIDFISAARNRDIIGLNDYDDVVSPLSSARRAHQKGQGPGSNSQKASRIAVGDAINLLLAVARILAAAHAGASAAVPIDRMFAERLGDLVIALKPQIDAIARTLQPDVRQALFALIEEAERPREVATDTGSDTLSEPVPDDVEARARDLILAGQAPPSAWRPFINRIKFPRERLIDLNLLAGLTVLQDLDLDDTEVSDVAPLAGLTALRHLYLTGTRVSDVAPLAGLTALQTLALGGTRVSDVAPLAGLTALQRLHLKGTQVTDVAPLAGLTALQSLDLNGTQVSDVAPLAGLTALQSLDLNGTQASDVAPLAGLTALQSLGLDGTQVSDMAPLAGLTALQILRLDGTQVSDVAPLASLTALQILRLDGTLVSDVTPLAGLTALQILSLAGTQVSDVAPLAGLTTLKRLYLNGTQVSDVAPLDHLEGLHIFALDPSDMIGSDVP